jgi:hypothetical protein
MIKDALSNGAITVAFQMLDSSFVVFSYTFAAAALSLSALGVQKSILNADDLIQYVYRGLGNRGLMASERHTYFSVRELF